jgi:polyhydroxyalkanoate synthesis repressor PhaR
VSRNAGQTSVLVIKQYAGRRFYDPTGLRYLTLDDMRRMAAEGVDFVVYDSESGQDITRMLLTIH